MPISINDFIKSQNNKPTTKDQITKSILDDALTGNGNNSRGYINNKNHKFFDFIYSNNQQIKDYTNDKDYLMPEVKTTIIHPYDISNSNKASTNLSMGLAIDNYPYNNEFYASRYIAQKTQAFVSNELEADKSKTLEYNDMFNVMDDDTFDFKVSNASTDEEVAIKVVPTAIHRLTFKKNHKAKKVFQVSAIIVSKHTADKTNSKYEYVDVYEKNTKGVRPDIINNMQNTIQIAHFDNPTQLANVLSDWYQFYTNPKNGFDIISNTEFDSVRIMDLATQNMANNLTDTYKATIHYFAQLFHKQFNVNKDAAKSAIASYLQNVNLAIDKLPNGIQEFLKLDDYKDLFKDETAVNKAYLQLNDSTFNQILTLNLSLNNNLNKLKTKADNNELYKFEAKDQTVKNMVNNSKNFSDDQKHIITETNPLVIGVAGAGSGKSHTIVGRLAYLQQQQEDMSKVLVLSFTNTAADNITAKYPTVRSLTLSKLFHEIYKLNFGSQELSDDKVLAASLSLLNTDSSYFKRLNISANKAEVVRTKLTKILTSMTAFRPRYRISVYMNELSSLINKDYKVVMALLNGINQTSITLEPIIINSLLINESLDSLKIPDEIQDINFIITDESQDISTFEYVLLTELSCKYNSNLMIVGDATQTLYEFRDSNPDFLNTIEASGFFKLHRLNRNYRSNSEILAMSNQFLDVIEANRFAKIRLTSDNILPINVQSFQDKVTLENVIIDDINENNNKYVEELKKSLFTNDKFIKWIVDKINNDEQIGIMAFTKAETKAVEDVIKTIGLSSSNKYGLKKEIKIGTLMKDQKRPSSLATNILHKMKLRDVNNRPTIDTKLINFKNAFKIVATTLFKDKSKAFVPGYVNKTINEFVKSNSGQKLLQSAVNSTDAATRVYTILTDMIIKAEIKVNQMNTYLSLTQNNDDDNNEILKKCNVVTTTIHSAKGLEFDNTVIVHRQTERKSRSAKNYEEKLRLFGVALTRAKQKEYIINTLSEDDANNSITHSQVGMYVSPMQTGYARVLDDIRGTVVQP